MFRWSTYIALVLGTLVPSWASACSIASILRPFDVSASNASSQIKLAAPLVTVEKIKRGTAPAGVSCDDAGILSVAIRAPEGAYILGEVGFFFTVVEGKTPDEIFPTQPVTGALKDGVMYFSFVWLDGDSRKRPPLNFVAEVRAVTQTGVQSIPARVTIREKHG